MNIEELFENEKWAGYGIVVTDDANQSIDYLKEEVMEYVAGLQKRIDELEEALKIATHWMDDEVPSYVVRKLKTVQETK